MNTVLILRGAYFPRRLTTFGSNMERRSAAAKGVEDGVQSSMDKNPTMRTRGGNSGWMHGILSRIGGWRDRLSCGLRKSS